LFTPLLPSQNTLLQETGASCQRFSSRLSTTLKDTARFDTTPIIETILHNKNEKSNSIVHKISDNSPSITQDSSRMEHPSFRDWQQSSVKVSSKPPIKLNTYKPVLNSRLRTPMYAMTFREAKIDPVQEDSELLPELTQN